ncbi:MAG: spore germination protein [Clostridia bacterium]|nr:spore germination protein [Clostridia bacterium]
MEEKANDARLRQSFYTSIDENIDNMQVLLHYPINGDVIFREYCIGEKKLCVVFIEGMANEERIGNLILHAVKSASGKNEMPIDITFLQQNLIETAQARLISEFQEAVSLVLTGMSCVFLDGDSEAIIIETRNYAHRQVGKPGAETVISGSQEGFNENLRTNITLVRRYVQSAELISERMTVGTDVPTMIAVLYLDGTANKGCVKEVKKRLMTITAPTVQGTGGLEQLIEDHPFAVLPQMLQTERPDRTASCLKDGQIAILVENSPYALIAPITFFHLIHASDDSFLRWQYGTALRIVRILGALLSLLMPSLYVAVTLFHTQLIPMPLLTSIAESRANVPFSIFAEVLCMEFAFYLLNEAGLRTPSQIGSAFGIVGALILGQAAVSASIVSPILIIIIAITGLGNYVIPNYGFSIGMILYRLLLLFLSAFMGIFGLIIGLFLIVTHLCTIKSFGIPYFAPVSPLRPHNPDILLRLPVWLQKKRMYFSVKRTQTQRKEPGNG